MFEELDSLEVRLISMYHLLSKPIVNAFLNYHNKKSVCFDIFLMNILPRFIDSDVIGPCNCNSHLAESFLETQNRIFLSKCPLIKLPDASCATKS